MMEKIKMEVVVEEKKHDDEEEAEDGQDAPWFVCARVWI